MNWPKCSLQCNRELLNRLRPLPENVNGDEKKPSPLVHHHLEGNVHDHATGSEPGKEVETKIGKDTAIGRVGIATVTVEITVKEIKNRTEIATEVEAEIANEDDETIDAEIDTVPYFLQLKFFCF